MGKFIAERTIAEMTEAKINPMGAKVAVLGITFKENCPDLRNTKVPNIIDHLKIYGCKITVSDPFANINEAKEHLNIDLLDLDQIARSDVVILTVAHDDYKEFNKEQWQKMFNGNGILIDVKSIYEKDYFTDTNIVHWRL
jgi:UDP-N-acetyl-D-galactosamine dehydrogenase